MYWQSINTNNNGVDSYMLNSSVHCIPVGTHNMFSLQKYYVLSKVLGLGSLIWKLTEEAESI